MSKKRKYDANLLEQAVRDVSNKSYRSADRKYDIPKSTIEFKIKHLEHKSTFGLLPVLTENYEMLVK